jgi:sugar lactone lactonase YvrE
MDVLCHPHDQVGESPVWSVRDQALWWVDIEGRRVHRFDWTSRRLRSWRVAQRVGCIALHARGGLLAAMETGIFHLALPEDAADATATLVAAAAFPAPGMRFNDGRTDRRGRFWVTSMVRDMSLMSPAGALYRLDANGLSAPVIEGLVTGNGLGFADDGQRMYLSDSHPSVRTVWAFDLDAAGKPHQRRVFVDMNTHAGRPDGAAVDDEGCYWSCANDAGKVHRFSPEGHWLSSLDVPTPKPSMCAFGGPGLTHLFVTSITPPSPVAGYDASLAGAVFVAQPGPRGMAEVAFDPSG